MSQADPHHCDLKKAIDLVRPIDTVPEINDSNGERIGNTVRSMLREFRERKSERSSDRELYYDTQNTLTKY